MSYSHNLPTFAQQEALRMWDAGCDTLTISKALSVHESIVTAALIQLRDQRRQEREWQAAAPKHVECVQ